MKSEMKPATKAFQPVTLSITIESLGEAIALLGRLNVPQNVVRKHLEWAMPERLGLTEYVQPDFTWEDNMIDGPFELVRNLVEDEQVKIL